MQFALAHSPDAHAAMERIRTAEADIRPARTCQLRMRRSMEIASKKGKRVNTWYFSFPALIFNPWPTTPMRMGRERRN